MEPWMENSIIITMNGFFVMNVILVLQLLFGISLCKKISHYVLMGALFIGIDAFSVLVFGENSVIEAFIIYGYMVLCTFLLSPQNRVRGILYTIPGILLILEWDSVLALFDTLFRLKKYSIALDGMDCAPFYLFSDILVFAVLVLLLIYSSKKSKRIQLTIKEIIFLSAFCIFSTMIIAVFEEIASTFKNPHYSLTWMTFVIIINVAIFYGVIYRNYAKYYRTLSENFKEQFNSEYSYFKDYKEQQKDVVKFRHDYRNHMILLSSLLENGDYEKAKEYFSKLSLVGGNTCKKYMTGSEIVDIILNAKQEQLEEGAIEVKCSGGLEPLKIMENVDCCVLFSNLIDNAIEANYKCEKERHITIKATREHQLYMVEMSNKTNKTTGKQEELLQTTKVDGNHGIGTKNALEIIKKYQGECRIFIREQDFVVQMIFPIDRLS